MTAPMITVVTPSFNQAAFISATLDSVRGQSFQDIEHLIYDPGSTDGSVETIEAYCAEYERAHFVSGQDKSQTNAINLGFARAQGEILCWLNSDDTFFDEDTLAEVVRQFEADPDLDILYGRGQFVSPDGTVLREAYINRDHVNIRALMANSLGILQPSLFMRRRVFEAVGQLDEGMNFSFDYEYWARCARRGMTFRFIDRLMSRAVIHDDAKTMRLRDISLTESLTVARRYYGFVSDDWVRRKADHVLNDSDGIIRIQTAAEGVDEVSAEIFSQENTNGVALSAFFNSDPMINDATRSAFEELVSHLLDRAYLSGWDANYFDMGVTLLASIHRMDPQAWIFVYDLGMTDVQRAFLRQLDQVILLEREFAPYRHDWQRSPKNYVFKIVLFHHLITRLPKGCRLLWVDAGVMLLERPGEIFDRIAAEESFFIDHSDSRHWPLFNASFTSDDAILAGQFTPAELAGPHVCSCLFGCLTGSLAQDVFARAAEMAADEKIAVGDKHPPESQRHVALSKEQQVAEAERLASVHAPVTDTEEIRKIFGYYGHRQDQSIISLLVARNGLPVSSAATYCPANDASSQISRENWFEGVSGNLGNFSPVPEDQLGITFHHRGLVKDFRGLRFAFDRQPVAGILGNGPSLAEIDLTTLTGVDGFGMNAAYRYWHETKWYPQFYSCLDTVVGMSHKEEIRELVRNRHMYGIKAFLLRHNLVDWLAETGDLDGVMDFDLIRFGVQQFLPEPVTTGSHTLGWAAFLGYENGFVAGVDCNYVEKVEGSATRNDGTLEIAKEAENPNYFFGGYQQVGDQFNVPNPSKDLHIRSWRNIAAMLPEQMDVRNVSAISRMDAFPKTPLEIALESFAQSHFAPTSVQEAPAASDEAVTSGSDVQILSTLEAKNELEKGESRVLVTFEDPVWCIARALEDGLDPSQFLVDWHRHMQEAMPALRQNWARVVLVEKAALLTDPTAYLPYLEEQGVVLPGSFPSAPTQPGSLYLALAQAFVAAETSVRSLLDELQARSIWPLGKTSEHVVAVSQLSADVRTLQNQIQEGVRVAERLKAQNEQIFLMRKLVQTLDRDVMRLRGEVQSQVEEHGHLTAEAHRLRAELDKVYHSTSWKITGPMRSLRRTMSGVSPKSKMS